MLILFSQKKLRVDAAPPKPTPKPWIVKFWVVAGVFAFIAAGLGAQAQSQSSAPNDDGNQVRYLLNVPLVELFTSQGCPNCPRADRALGAIADKGTSLALSVHVDYWDYTGWADPFGSTANTQRQIQYKNSLDVPYVFTPQFVLNGQLVLESQATSGLEMALKMFQRDAQIVRLSFRRRETDGKEVVVLPQTVMDRPGALQFVFFYPPQITVPDSGRNRGKQLHHAHSVARWSNWGQWSGEPLEVEWPNEDFYGTALILSDSVTREVLATAAVLDSRHTD